MTKREQLLHNTATICPLFGPAQEDEMGAAETPTVEVLRVDPSFVSERMREVVADEPKAFAYDIGVSLSTIHNYLNGRIPSTEMLFRIARFTGRPMEWFLDPNFVTNAQERESRVA